MARSRPMRPSSLARVPALAVGSLALALLLTSCASSGTPQAAGAVSALQSVELHEEQSIATFHFPRGLYSLDSEDSTGYYYRATHQIMKHSFAGFAQYEGGIFVAKGTRTKVCGYIIWAGGRTKIGDLTRAHYTFRD